MILNYLILLLLTFVYCEEIDNNVIVETNSGLIKGVKVASDISDFIAFFSIPYAEPPVGDKRFELPEPIKPWTTTRDATKEGPGCMQSNEEVPYQDEDCLTLSVYTTNTTGDKPVYVYIHGGAFEKGSAELSSFGPDYFMKHDVVIVVIQFRVAMFGFLNLDSENAPGNMGLADAIEAIKWVKANIQYFGGNPDEITIGGLSSGGIMAHTLLISPKSQNLFQKVVIQSGTSLSYRFFIADKSEPIQKTKDALNMTSASNEEVLEKLKTLTSTEILTITKSIQDGYHSGYAKYYPYCMTKDLNGILPENPITLLNKFEYQQIPMFIGRTSKEGLRLEAQMNNLDYVNDHIEMLVPNDIYSVDDRSVAKSALAETIKEFYFGNNPIRLDTLSIYMDLGTDSWYGHITDYAIRLQGSKNYSANVYYYMFSVDGAFNQAKIIDNLEYPGVNHADDEGYIWRKTANPNLTSIVPNDDYSEIARERYVVFLANFIKYGDPTPEITDLLPIKWEPVKYPVVNYLNFNATLTMGQDLHRDRLLFWQKLYGYPEI